MDSFITTLLAGPQGPLFISVLVFLAAAVLVIALGLVTIPRLQTQARIDQELREQGLGDSRSLAAQAQMRRMRTRKPVEAYFSAVERSQGKADSIERRLFEAGFYGSGALVLFQLSRVVLVVAGFLAALTALNLLVADMLPAPIIFAVALVFGLGFMVIPAIALDMYAKGIKEQYRRGFPDFMDMMITCADAGMSLEAAIDRVSNEFAATHKHLGVQLSILTLQLRAGKPLRDALRDLADRVALDEAKSLAVLFRQSEELGTSLVDALRVYSVEMRTQRVLNAEEKANSLPVRMVLPLGLCVFPVVLMIIMLPVIIRMRGVFF